MKKTKDKVLPKFELASINDCPNAIGIMAAMNLYMVRENRSVLQGKVEAADLDWKYFKEKRQQAAFLDALQGMEETGLLRKSEDRYEWITYQICAEALEAAMAENGFPELIIRRKASVRFYKLGHGPKSGAIESDVQEIATMVSQLAIVEQEMVRTPEITSAIKRIVKEEADTVSMSQGGGLWFLSPQFVGLARKLEFFIKSLKGNNRFFFFPISGDEKNRGNIWESVAADIRGKIRELDRTGDAVAKLITSSEKRPEGRIETVQKTYAQERERILSYAELLQQSSEKLLEELEISKQKLNAKIAI